MSEWPKEHAWKACVSQGTVGSNPTLSARQMLSQESGVRRRAASGFCASFRYHPPMSYRVLARRYRPRTFAQVVGQDPIVQGLARAIEKGRVAQAYLFVGPRGVGKTSSARILAKSLNCHEGETVAPCL